MSDRGGGVPLRKIESLFSYMYSTAPSPVHTDNSRNAPLVRAGLKKTDYSMKQSCTLGLSCQKCPDMHAVAKWLFQL